MKLDFVTSNSHKYEEISHYLQERGYQCRWVRMKYEEIQADTTEEVSMASLNALENLIDGPFFLEDTGLYIKSLNGFPGPYSSYVMKSIGNEGILKLLDGMPRDATFITVVSFRDQRGKHQFRGECKGGISMEMRGKSGFGYDPIFIPDGEKKTYAEMTLEEKNRNSHRIRAMESFLSYLQEKS